VIQHLFTAYSRCDRCRCRHVTRRGIPSAQTGRPRLTWRRAVQHFGVAEHTLRQLFGDALGPLLTDADARELGRRKTIPARTL
jgi:hypothetical protein